MISKLVSLTCCRPSLFYSSTETLKEVICEVSCFSHTAMGQPTRLYGPVHGYETVSLHAVYEGYILNLTPLPRIPFTTRIITFLVGHPYNI